MRKNTLLLFFSFSFLFIFGLFLPSFISADDTIYPDCSNVSGYSLTQGQTCSINIKTPVVFNFKAIDPDGNNLTWSVDWGDKTFGLSFSCPSNLPNSKLSVNHSWASEGTYNVRLGVSNCKGGEAQASFNVVVRSASYVEGDDVITIPDIDPNVISDIVVPIQNWPDKVPWLIATQLPFFKFEVKNTGIKSFAYTVSYGDKEEYTVPANQSAEYNFKKGDNILYISFSTKNCGPRKVKVVLNSDKKIAETDYTNNSFEKIIDVDCSKPAYNFDMTLEKVGTWPTTSLQGNYIGLNGKFFNLGKEEDPRFSWLYHGYNKDSNKPGHGPVCLYRTDSKGTHEIECPAVSSTFGVSDQPICGNNHYVFKVDAYNDVVETNENNNEISGDVFVDCSKKPDFVIEKVGTWPTTVKSGSKPIFNFIEKNIGETTAGRAGTVRMTVNDQYEAGSWYFGSLGVGSSTGSTLFGYQAFSSPPTDNDWWIPICSKGDKFTLKACADNACGWGSSEIEESNENNNILTHEVTCE